MAAGLRFAREQLEKAGWKDGSGLGRHESGITEAIKVKIKKDNKGVGHNAGDEFSFHWWDHAFNKAASNIKVNDTEAGVSVKMEEESGPLSSKRPQTQKMLDSKSLLYGTFVKSSTVMTNGVETKQVKDGASSESSDEEDLDQSSKRADEDLFKMCGGRTAHKGARHGLCASGKLERVKKSEQDLLEKMRKKLHEVREKEATKEASKRQSYGSSSAVLRGQLKKSKYGYDSEESSEDSESESEVEDGDDKRKDFENGFGRETVGITRGIGGIGTVDTSENDSDRRGTERTCSSSSVCDADDTSKSKKRKKKKYVENSCVDSEGETEVKEDNAEGITNEKMKRKKTKTLKKRKSDGNLDEAGDDDNGSEKGYSCDTDKKVKKRKKSKKEKYTEVEGKDVGDLDKKKRKDKKKKRRKNVTASESESDCETEVKKKKKKKKRCKNDSGSETEVKNGNGKRDKSNMGLENEDICDSVRKKMKKSKKKKGKGQTGSEDISDSETKKNCDNQAESDLTEKAGKKKKSKKQR